MPSITPTILAVGAAGAFAGLVVPELAKRGANVRGLVRDARQGEEVRKHGTFELCAEGWLNRKDVAAIIGEVLGRPIKAERVDPKMAAGAGPGAPALEKMFDWYEKRGLLGNALTLRAILGHEPRTLRTFFEELMATKG